MSQRRHANAPCRPASRVLELPACRGVPEHGRLMLKRRKRAWPGEEEKQQMTRKILIVRLLSWSYCHTLLALTGVTVMSQAKHTLTTCNRCRVLEHTDADQRS